mgnify:CR=1 FL=1
MTPLAAVARAIAENCEQYEETFQRAARAAIEALAANVTDEMVHAYRRVEHDDCRTGAASVVSVRERRAIAAAIREGVRG